MELGSQIKKYRKRDKISQEELAEKIYVSRQSISNWENDRSYPDIHNIMMMSVIFKVSIDDLVQGDVNVMKHDIDKKSWNKWSYIMMLTFIVSVFLTVPAFMFDYTIIKVIAGLFFIMALISSIKIEKLKHEYNLHTYNNIVEFMEGKNNSVGVNKHNMFSKFIPYLAFAMIFVIVFLLSYFIFKP